MEEKVKILMCEDDENLGPILKEYFQAKGFLVDLAPDGEMGYKAFFKGSYDLCLLDVMMPKKDGFTLAKQIRQENPDVPIVFLTGKYLTEDIIEGFKVGADDYVTKPFSMEVLYYRIEAIMRRVQGTKLAARTIYHIGQYVFDAQRRELKFGDETQALTTKETELLALLASHSNEILQRNVALKKIWIDDNYFNARSMDVYVTRLRHKFEKDPSIKIVNIHGKGYKLTF